MGLDVGGMPDSVLTVRFVNKPELVYCPFRCHLAAHDPILDHYRLVFPCPPQQSLSVTQSKIFSFQSFARLHA